MHFRLLCISLLGLSLNAQAAFSIPGFELVQTAPVETTLSNSDLADPVTVWCQQFDAAKNTIDIAQFYVTSEPGEPLEPVLKHLRQAGERGVKIRFLMDLHGVRMSNEPTLAAIKSIPNLTFQLIDFGKIGGGIVHAKYIVVDGKSAFVGSQNFDWRALKHIHETGLLITDSKIAAQVQAIFNVDWQAQQLLAEGKAVPVLNHQVVAADESQSAYLVASPNAYNPAGVGDSESELPKLLAKAEHEVYITVMTYAPLSYSYKKPAPYYAVIDDAIRAAAQRGVKIHLMISAWNTGKPYIDYLKSLQVLPNIDVKVVTIPEAKQGFIPFARTLHSKTMEIDGKIAWIGTSNWEGGYMNNSRNLELVLQNPAMANRLQQLQLQLWNSVYAAPLDINKEYPKPHPASAN
ncbi:phospholipase D-like domain-containing protein [Shewanella sp. A32]|uniref:phospholipase D-like domain-containing protein n=1 Tax=Shewanella sp. A32 TaxID=3031327 RepID=UPI0023B98E41|nr:phospholipase D-like domain-containing protein [Shewanella sp. A32]MDF0533978.1 phospholipase D-like domain-containing protein [Shewanella sp. A32]